MYAKPKKRQVWTKVQDEELIRRHGEESLSDIARDMGYSYSAVLNHAHKLGFYHPVTGGYNARARRIIREKFHTHSYNELAKLTGVSNVTVWKIIDELGLKKTDEQYKTMLSRIRKDIFIKERRRVNWGLEQKTKLKVYGNRKKSRLRSRLIRKGYLRGEDDFMMYYTEDTNRSVLCEEHGSAMGLRFGPLPTVNSEETEFDSASQGMWEVRPEQISFPEYV